MTRLERRNYGRGHGYKLDGTKVVGVTTVIDTLDKPALRQWYANEAAKRVVDDWDTIVAMKPSDRLEYVKFGARDTVRAAALRGTEIHTLGEKLLHGDDVTVPDEHRGPVEAYVRFLDAWDVEPIASETPLAHVEQKYAGTADVWARIGKRDGAVCLYDVKTGKGVYDETGLQLAAYRFSSLMQPEKGVEIPTPAAELTYVAHVLPDTVRMVPVTADERVFRTFLYLLQVHRERTDWADFPLIGEAEQP